MNDWISMTPQDQRQLRRSLLEDDLKKQARTRWPANFDWRSTVYTHSKIMILGFAYSLLWSLAVLSVGGLLLMILIVAGTVGLLDEPLERGIFFGVVGVFSLLLGTATAAVSLANNHNGRADALLLAELEAEFRNEHRVEIFEEVDRRAEEMREAGELLDEDFPDEYFERRLAIFTEAYRRLAEKDWRARQARYLGMRLFDEMLPEKQKQLLREVIRDIDKKPDGDVS